jgi:hypothetical protein
MGLVEENESGYIRSSMITYAGNLEGHMMLVHSLMDDNVHPQNTFQLARAMIDNGKSIDLKIYPPGTHRVSYDMNSRVMLYSEYLDFLKTHLNPEQLTKPIGDCPCCGPEHDQFDFWTGHWTVYDSLDQVVGTNRITKSQKNCLLMEHWTSANNSTGTSYNYFMKSDSTWNQVWVDDQGGVLELKGNFTGNVMVLKSDPLKRTNGAVYYHRITWEPVGKEVIQTWEVLDEAGQVSALLFKGTYRKTGS